MKTLNDVKQLNRAAKKLKKAAKRCTNENEVRKLERKLQDVKRELWS